MEDKLVQVLLVVWFVRTCEARMMISFFVFLLCYLHTLISFFFFSSFYSVTFFSFRLFTLSPTHVDLSFFLFVYLLCHLHALISFFFFSSSFTLLLFFLFVYFLCYLRICAVFRSLFSFSPVDCFYSEVKEKSSACVAWTKIKQYVTQTVYATGDGREKEKKDLKTVHICVGEEKKRQSKRTKREKKRSTRVGDRVKRRKEKKATE